MFEILYYCGLRKGELRGLTWKNIDLVNKTLSIKKQITDRGGSVKEFQFSTPKTKSSIRTLPLNKALLNDFKMLKEEVTKEYEFNDDYFVIGDAFPVASINVVTKYLGHTKIEETLNTSTHLFNSALNEVVDLIDNLD